MGGCLPLSDLHNGFRSGYSQEEKEKGKRKGKVLHLDSDEAREEMLQWVTPALVSLTQKHNMPLSEFTPYYIPVSILGYMLSYLEK